MRSGLRHAAARLSVALAAGLLATFTSHAVLAAPDFHFVAAPYPGEASELHAPLVRGPDGLAYGMAWYGGPNNGGAVYRIEADGSTFTVLHEFGAGTDGSQAPCGLMLGADGWLYGTTQVGGTNGEGILFKISTAGDYVVIYNFGPQTLQGAGYPSGPLVQDAEGNLYGTLGGGTSQSPYGAVFKLTAAGTFKLLHVFADAGDGNYPDALVIAADGVVFGTTAYTHGTYGGTLFSLGRDGKFQVLHTFDCASDGCQPYGRLVTNGSGVIFGAAPLGGFLNNGTIYAWKHGSFGVLHVVGDGDHLGAYPQGGVEIDTQGNLYSTTQYGGPAKAGVLFALRPDGMTKVLHAFGQDASGGAYPVSAPTLFPGGQLWGTTLQGGQSGGIVFWVQLPQ